MDNRPIGVFDSGLGGLTGVRAARSPPHEEIIYFMIPLRALCRSSQRPSCSMPVRTVHSCF